MAIVSNTINYLDEGTLLEGFFAYDNGHSGIRPTILISHAWAGRDGFVDEKAKKLAEMGYFAFALDMYGQGVHGESLDENSALMQPFLDDRAFLQQRIKAALQALKCTPWADETKIVAMGFCFGGLCVLDLARTGVDIKGVIAFHALLHAPDNLQTELIKAKILLLHGADDPMNTPETVAAIQTELTLKKADWQLHSYGHTLHAFTNPKANNPDFGTVYHSDADKRSWQAMQNFLDEVFA
ncbi:MAG: dienelactone hydrolase family protein [Methylococcales bacterium]|nr:dienelactone hydrolase family protein [Methylococcales bacterium]MCK5926383.1 dienelactone hydrolase family protein [Methylococcales bacterium]